MTGDKTIVVLRVFRAPGEQMVDVYLTIPVSIPALSGGVGRLTSLYGVIPDGRTVPVRIRRMETDE